MKYIVLAISLLGLGVWLMGCDNDHPKPIDPCEGKKAVTAEFGIYQQWSGGWSTPPIPTFKVDTLMALADDTATTNWITFKAESGFASYEWKIGGDERVFTDSILTLLFDSDAAFELIEVRLIVKDSLQALCFPGTSDADTLVKSFVVVTSEYSNAMFGGSYVGRFESSPNDMDTVEIILSGYGIVINNINKGCDMTAFAKTGDWLDGRSFYRTKLFYNGYYNDPLDKLEWWGVGCLLPYGWISLSQDRQTLTVTFTYFKKSPWLPPPTEQANDVFIGKRLNP